MSKMIQIRNVPEGVHRKLKSRAALEGKSLSDYLLEEVRRLAERPTLAEMLERLKQRPRENPSPTPTQMIREDRDSR
jgi:plasmid stability protein